MRNMLCLFWDDESKTREISLITIHIMENAKRRVQCRKKKQAIQQNAIWVWNIALLLLLVYLHVTVFLVRGYLCILLSAAKHVIVILICIWLFFTLFDTDVRGLCWWDTSCCVWIWTQTRLLKKKYFLRDLDCTFLTKTPSGTTIYANHNLQNHEMPEDSRRHDSLFLIVKENVDCNHISCGITARYIFILLAISAERSAMRTLSGAALMTHDIRHNHVGSLSWC